MHTQNVNTAASESSKTWVKTPESVYFTRKIAALAELAQIEGDMMAYGALERLGIEDEESDESAYLPLIAHDRIELLAAMGGIDSPGVYEIVSAVDELINELNPTLSPDALPPLNTLRAAAGEQKALCLADIQESLKPFSVDVRGQMEYREEYSSYGETYWTESSMHLGRTWTITEALELAKATWVKEEWNPREDGECYYDEESGRDVGPISFSPSLIVICDEKGKTVLTGNASDLSWNEHVTDPAGIARINAAQEELLSKARFESGWDNYETARQLRTKAEDLSKGIVDSAWQGHADVTAALVSFLHPTLEHPDEEREAAEYEALLTDSV
ncbi:hypothetical protein RM153_22135 (plasmid) [Pantoea agglomerans]|uniref:hypothetical protein n=1 Tax=Enterobacter agglomerans TaxID=549 RepID=UPI00289F4649|nr:hypothetical protein [Pantoea agglomerans]WNK51207.1 hypothetical protein RM153_22135 [Pantoea agglomerans]